MDTYAIPFNNKEQLYIATKPKGGDDLEACIYNLTKLGNTLVLCSLLTKNEIRTHQLENEKEVCNKNNIEFLQLEILDESIPGYQSFIELVNLLVKKITNGKTIVIHCKHGIGRSGMIAVAILLHFNCDLEEACNLLTKTRGYKVPQSNSQLKLLSHYYKNIK